MKRLDFSILALGTIFTAGCVAYNSSCALDDSQVIAQSDVAFDLRADFLRTREAPIGNLVADAIYYAANNDGHEANLAVIPAAQFSNLGICGVREEIPRGNLTSNDISYLLQEQEDPSLVIIEMTPQDLKRLLERSVSALGDPAAEQQAGFFLQVSDQLKFAVDCSQQANQTFSDGSEYAGMRIDDTTVFLGKSGHEITLENWLTDEPIKVATTADLASGNYGYDFLNSLPQAATLTTNLTAAVNSYLENNISPVTAEKISSHGDTPTEGRYGRIRLSDNCFLKD